MNTDCRPTHAPDTDSSGGECQRTHGQQVTSNVLQVPKEVVCNGSPRASVFGEQEGSDRLLVVDDVYLAIADDLYVAAQALVSSRQGAGRGGQDAYVTPQVLVSS